jgi:hypothetical protein
VRFDSGITDIPSAGTAVRILDTTDRVLWIKFTAPAANAGLTYVGLSDVSATNGYPLGHAGGVDATVELNFKSFGGSVFANVLYIDAASSGDGDDVAWIMILE